MVEIAQPIDLDLPHRLQDREFRARFFLAESSAQIARQLIALRKKRGLNQTQVADLVHTQQPAISRVERADYNNWNFKTLRALAEAMDARIRVLIQPSEDVLSEYEDASNEEPAVSDENGDAAQRAFFERNEASQQDDPQKRNQARSEFGKRREPPLGWHAQ